MLKISLETPKMRPILQFLIFLIFFFLGGGRQKGILHIIKKSHGTALIIRTKPPKIVRHKVKLWFNKKDIINFYQL